MLITFSKIIAKKFFYVNLFYYISTVIKHQHLNNTNYEK